MHSWDDFRYFRAVARHGSFSVAAKSLGVNHSTVSRRIQVLEERHGVRLFERTRSGYGLTEAGESIVELVEQIHNDSQKASRLLLGLDSRLEGKIKLTMPHDLFESCLVEPLKQFVDQNPLIQLSLSVTHGLRDLANREADLAVRFTPSPPDYLVGKCITPIQHGIYVNPDVYCRNELRNEAPIILWSADDDLPPWAEENFSNPRVALRVDDLASMHRAVAAGFGIARMPCFFPDSSVSKHVVRLPIVQPRSHWGVWLLSHVDLRNTARIKHLNGFLNDVLQPLKPLFLGESSRYCELENHQR